MLSTCLIEVLLRQSFVIQSQAFSYACCTHMLGTFTNTDTLQAESADHKGAVSSRADMVKGLHFFFAAYSIAHVLPWLNVFLCICF